MGMNMVMNRLRADGALRDDRTPEEAAEIAWALASPHHYEFLVIDRQWPPERFRAHLEDVIAAAVLRQA
jgi:hypothetical protein